MMMSIIGTSFARDIKAYESLVHEKNELTSRLVELESIQKDLSSFCNSKNFKKRISTIKRTMYFFGTEIQDVFPDFNKTVISLNNYFDLYNQIQSIENKLYDYQQDVTSNESVYHSLLVDRRVLVDRFEVLKFSLCGELKSTIDNYLAFTSNQINDTQMDLAAIERQVSIFEQSISLNEINE